MISREQAEWIAGEVLGSRSEDVEQGWTLEEFGAGWLIVRNAVSGRRGGASLVVERDTGRVMRFPSYIPPTRILEEYDQVAAGGAGAHRVAGNFYSALTTGGDTVGEGGMSGQGGGVSRNVVGQIRTLVKGRGRYGAAQ